MMLTIAIPTYNRAKRLKKSLHELFVEINSSNNKDKVSVFVSDNGSKDFTSKIIEEAVEYYSIANIPINYTIKKSNEGVASNVYKCYEACMSKYIWFLSDDDNIIVGALDNIINALIEYEPSVAYFNHNQKPYEFSSPYISRTEYFEEVNIENIRAIQKIINFPKLTSYVLKVNKLLINRIDLTSSFPHTDLALQLVFSEGRVLHSSIFTAYPDSDFLDHIDFPPFVGNSMNPIIKRILIDNNLINYYKILRIENADKLVTSLGTLGTYYRGKFTLTYPLKKILWDTVLSEINITNLFSKSFLKALFKFSASLIYGSFKSLFLGKKITKLRQVPPE